MCGMWNLCIDTYCYGSVLPAVLGTHLALPSVNSWSSGLDNCIKLFH